MMGVLILPARHLQRSGFETVTATSGVEGLALAAEIRPCAITLDVVMPEMDGWSVLAELKADEDLKDIPVVMVSMVDDKSTGFTLGATGYLTKPVDRDLLLEAIGKHSDTASHVLIVEDEDDTRSMMTRILKRAGFTTSEAANGEEALEAIASQKPDLVLLDLMMPVMDGFDFLLAFRSESETAHIPVLVVTAKDLSDAEHRFLSDRVQKVLAKGGYTREQLLGLVRTALA